MSRANADNGCVLLQFVGGGSFFTIVIGLVSHSRTFCFHSLCVRHLLTAVGTRANRVLSAVCFVGSFEHSPESQQPWQAR